MVIGQLLAYAGLEEGLNVSWYPAYGPEMRGGTANCTMVLSDAEVASPVVSRPSAVLAMNGPSLERFGPCVQEGGLILFNSSLIAHPPHYPHARSFGIPVNEMALEMGELRVANMIMLGAFLGFTGAVSLASAVKALQKVLPARRHHLIPLNEEALRRGERAALSLLEDQRCVSEG